MSKKLILLSAYVEPGIYVVERSELIGHGFTGDELAPGAVIIIEQDNAVSGRRFEIIGFDDIQRVIVRCTEWTKGGERL